MILATLICLNRPTPIILYFQLYIVYMYLTVFHLYYVICRKLSINFMISSTKEDLLFTTSQSMSFLQEKVFAISEMEL